MDAPRRQSDRWVTPGVVCVGILTLGALLALVVAAVTLLTVRGYDPGPVVHLAVQATGAAGAVLTAVLQLASRRTTTKVERNTGVLGRDVADALSELEESRGRHAPAQAEGPAPVSPRAQSRPSHSASGGHGPEGRADEDERYSDTPEDDLQDTAWFRQ